MANVGRREDGSRYECNLVVIERQGLLVLHTANFSEFAWADGEHAACAQRVWIPWARVLSCPRRSAGHRQDNDQKYKSSEAHPNSHDYLFNENTLLCAQKCDQFGAQNGLPIIARIGGNQQFAQGWRFSGRYWG
jgi:hypothetical protein